MNKSQKIEAIRKACIEANPMIRVGIPEYDIHDEHHGDSERPIRLADVLLAINYHREFAENKRDNLPPFAIQDWGCWMHNVQDELGEAFEWGEIRNKNWNLRTDDLTQQSDECIDFLEKILRR